MYKSVYVFLLLLFFFQDGLYSRTNNKSINNHDIKYVLTKPTASRTSGVAPLSVHFTAGFSNNTTTTRNFHNLDYTWDFGDPGSGTWGTSGKSKNTAKGPVTTHIFETAGTYTVYLIVKSGTTVVDTGSFKITVQDPDSVYSGINTICVSDTANKDFTGTPAGARLIATDDLSTIVRYATAGSRILLHRGSSWTTNGLSFPNNAGPVTIGAYGTGTGRDSSGIYNNAPLITVKGGSFCKLDNKQDWRITDLHLVNNERTGGPFGGAFNMQRILFQRLRIEGFYVGLGWTHWNDDRNLMTIDQMVI